MRADKKKTSEPTGGIPSWRIFIAIWIGLLLIQVLVGQCASANEISYSAFKDHLAKGEVMKVTLSETAVRGKLAPGVAKEVSFRAIRVDDPKLLEQLEAHDVEVTGTPKESGWSTWLSWLIPIGIVLLVFSWLRRRMGGVGGPGVMTFGRSKAKVYMEQEVEVTFEDVAGVDEAKEELAEVIEFLKTPDKFQRLGGKLPKGILLVGPPGTGKTLLARAVAGEAGVPFFSISGSEFVEMFVGVGAARVRDLFTEAKRKAPCIIFIDELDALGKARGVGPMAHEEREQTLNQLLVELDGFDPHAGVILMAATNRPEILDPALLRAGRFDRHVLVDRPDMSGRVAILKVHARDIELADDADLDAVAAMTAGFAGADLANIINEAALLAVRRGKDAVGNPELTEAIERVIAGLEKKNRVLRQEEKQRVAHHEVGHALVALGVPGSDRIQKVSIIPRGIAALGYTLQLPTEDRFLMTRSELEGKIEVLLGGRAAEELIYGEVSTGAQDDLRKATDIARSMVDTYGMSDRVGQVNLQRETQPLLMPGVGGREKDAYSEQTAREIDCEIRRIIDEQYARAIAVLREREPALRAAAARLLECETITGEELAEIAVRRSGPPERPHDVTTLQ